MSRRGGGWTTVGTAEGAATKAPRNKPVRKRIPVAPPAGMSLEEVAIYSHLVRSYPTRQTCEHILKALEQDKRLAEARITPTLKRVWDAMDNGPLVDVSVVFKRVIANTKIVEYVIKAT